MKSLRHRAIAGMLSVVLLAGGPALSIAAETTPENTNNSKTADGKSGVMAIAGSSESGRTQQILTETWKRQTLEGILGGKICIPDTTINAYFEENLNNKGDIKTITVKSVTGNRLWLDIDTVKLGRIKLLAAIEEFKHDAQTSHIKIRFLEKKLPKKPILNLFANIFSVGILANMLGKVDLGTGVKTKISGNTAIIEFHDYLYSSELGQLQYMGIRLLDFLVIKDAKADEGQINIFCDLKGGGTVRLLLP